MTSEAAKSGVHAFEGACMPEGKETCTLYATCSVGIYPHVARKSGGYKKGKVLVRVVGLVNNVRGINAKASEIVAALDAGTYKGPKTVRV